MNRLLFRFLALRSIDFSVSLHAVHFLLLLFSSRSLRKKAKLAILASLRRRNFRPDKMTRHRIPHGGIESSNTEGRKCGTPCASRAVTKRTRARIERERFPLFQTRENIPLKEARSKTNARDAFLEEIRTLLDARLHSLQA